MTPLAESMESSAMTDTEIEKIATGFVLWAIQEWGQSEAERIGSVQAALDAAHIQATATCWPVFGGIWPKPCAGPDADRAAAWLQEITDTMRRGHFEDEVAHVEAFIRKARGEQQ